MPASGPPQPDVPVAAIFNGAQHVTDHLLVGGVPMWLRLDSGHSRWLLVSAADVKLSADTFAALRSCVLDSPTVLVNGLRYALEPVPGTGGTWAELQPA